MEMSRPKLLLRSSMTLILTLVMFFWVQSAFAIDVEKWKQYRESFANSSWSGNPLDLDFQATFVNNTTGRTLTQYGFYAGNNEWRLYFMPDEEGDWSYITSSSDSDLDGKTGTFRCTAPTLKGSIRPSGKRWKYTDGGYVMPVMTSSLDYFRSRTLGNGVSTFIDWVDETMGGKIIHAAQLYYFRVNSLVSSQDSLAFIVNQYPDDFNYDFFDRMNGHLDYLRDKDMGMYVMFYSDDSQSPSNNGVPEASDHSISAIEQRLFKYAIARFGPYPTIIWDSGIDIGEFRSNTWIDNFVTWMKANDPWQHPVSSRTGGGSGGKFPPASSYYSDGNDVMPGFDTFVGQWQNRSVATAMTDRFREDDPTRPFTREEIRRAVWEVGLVGGSAILISDSESDNSGYLDSSYAQGFRAAPDAGHAVRFFEQMVANFSSLNPCSNLVGNSNYEWCSANPGSEYVVYLRQGNSGSVTLDLSAISGTFSAYWYDPGDGSFRALPDVAGGQSATLSIPGNNSIGDNDWALYLRSNALPALPLDPPTTPTNVQVEIIQQ